ncbi:hypothetical protein [Demequina flava]|uniref:hypothetical protein n=1 Tax=Demequina flava TaxID=1095025 RepID=UPI00078040E8|nr:hypothetical protein [Demequina flava]
MSVTSPQLRSAAALVAAVPGLVARVTTVDGDAIVVGAHEDAHLCSDAFRELVLEHHARSEDFARALMVDGIDPTTGFAHRDGVRWFVSPMPAKPTVACLRASGHTAAPLQALVRDDADLGLSVVALRDQSGTHTSQQLDEAATAAYGACLVEHLVLTTHSS